MLTCECYEGPYQSIQPEGRAMGLFNSEFYRSFFFGFGVTAVVLAVNIIPQFGA